MFECHVDSKYQNDYPALYVIMMLLLVMLHVSASFDVSVRLQYLLCVTVTVTDFVDCSYSNLNILGVCGFCPVSLTGRATECRDDGTSPVWSKLLPWAVISKSTGDAKDKWTDKSRANEQLQNYIWQYALIRLNPFSTSHLSYGAAFLAGVCRPPYPTYLLQLLQNAPGLDVDVIPSVCLGSSSASRLGSKFLKCSSFTLSFAPFV